MVNSKLLRTLCYILIPVLALIILLSALYELDVKERNEYLENTYNNENYFNSDSFLYDYMYTLFSEAKELIYQNNRFENVLDAESNIKICYCKGDHNYNSLKEYYYLIIYKNLAITNVELTVNTNSINKIINYIQNIDGINSTIINGVTESDSEIIKNKALQYYSYFDIDYYSLEEVEEVPEDYEINDVYITSSPITERVDYNTNINDFKIYTEHKEEISIKNNRDTYDKLLTYLANNYEEYIYTIPVCAIFLFIMILYLVISIGHSKNKDEIDINDFDKIPLEILIVLFGIIGCIAIALGVECMRSSYLQNSLENFIYTILITVYLIIYAISMTTFVTVVKRIKAKMFWSTTISGRIFKWAFKILKKILNKFKKVISNLKSSVRSLNSTLKLILLVMVLMPLLMIIFLLLGGFGIIIDCIILFVLLYFITIYLGDYEKIKSHLKKMYNGEEITKLDSSKFSSAHKETVEYINNIQNGYQNAVNEGIRSEKLKTELITNVSHDIKTPLTSIINYVDLLKKENIKNKKANEYIEVLDSKSQRLKKLTEDLVEASKASSGNVKLKFEKINVIELIKQTTGEFEDKFKENKLDIILNLPEEVAYINADSRYMYRIIENLFSNISKYALNGSRVYIDAEVFEEKVKITLKNISKEKLNISADELMQRFVRGDKSRTTEGSGLGLSISQNLTELQNGKFMLTVDGDLFKVELEFNIDE